MKHLGDSSLCDMRCAQLNEWGPIYTCNLFLKKIETSKVGLPVRCDDCISAEKLYRAESRMVNKKHSILEKMKMTHKNTPIMGRFESPKSDSPYPLLVKKTTPGSKNVYVEIEDEQQ